MIAPPSLEYPAVEDALELGALRKALQRARKGLLIAVADQPVLREAIRLWLSRVLDRPLEVRTLEEDRPLLEQIREADQAAEPEAILWLEGLERLPLSAIEALNRQRAGLSRLRHPLLLWTPTFRLRELMEHAPDLFDWHSGFYEFKAARTFAPEQALRWIELQMPSALSPQERQRRISLLEELRAEYSGSEEALPALATVLFQLGRLYAEGGFNFDLALERYREALACYERLGDLRGKGDTLRGMASIYVLRGDLDGAMRLYQEALEIDERLGDLQGKAATLHAMANVLVTRGDLDGAMRLYQEALEIFERLGDLLWKGATLREMASILRLRGDLDGAMRLYQEALEIFERLGNLRDKAVTLGMMGQALWAQGKRREAIASLWSGLELLMRLGIEPQTRQAMASDLARWRGELGAEAFDRLWRQVIGQEPPPWPEPPPP
jgi:tetratricopeptide (TPR) repeat protein